MCFEPLISWRHVTVSAHRTKHDWAHVLCDLVDEYYPEAEKIVLVMDNLNTHDFSSCECYPKSESSHGLRNELTASRLWSAERPHQ
jgi:hypothetical protein